MLTAKSPYAQQQMAAAVQFIAELAADRRTFIVTCLHCNKLCDSGSPEPTFAFVTLTYDMSLNVCICLDCLTKRRASKEEQRK